MPDADSPTAAAPHLAPDVTCLHCSSVRSIRALVLFTIVLATTRSDLVQGQELTRPVSSRFATSDTAEVPDFQRHVIPLLGRLGCNSARCHGSFQGQGGFRLSLFGFDFRADHQALRGAASDSAQRVNPRAAATSLILRKPTEQVEHEGGRHFDTGSWEHNLLFRWIESGARGAGEVAVSEAADERDSALATMFTQQIRPLLEDHCFECHGFNQSKGGLSLSSREGLLKGGKSGPAVEPRSPDRSLLLHAVRYEGELKMPPGGQLDSRKIAALEKWIRGGAPWPRQADYPPQDTGLVLADLVVEPQEILFTETGQQTQIRVTAVWETGEREDVTCLARFQTNDDAIVRVDRDGEVTSTGAGDTHVVAFYDNGVAAVPVIRPYQSQSAHSRPDPIDVHPVDRFVDAKLRKLGLVPSALCSDAEFLRRVSIDMTGTLPTPEEVTRFLADTTADKRVRKVDELLGRSTYAAWWANKLCDFTGCSPRSIASLLEVAREEGYVRATEWYDWIYTRVLRNVPYDKLVAGIMLADINGRDEGMPHFWTRQSLKEPRDTAMSVAHAFLGIQLQCAECHKHPFDQWTQADFSDFARFFDRATLAGRKEEEEVELRLLRSGVVRLDPGVDPRQPIMNWMQSPENPWFARAFVNRVWAGYFGVGIVDPPDQFTPANPPSHPRLLDSLTSGFVESGFNMKWLHRRIVTSAAYQRSWKPNSTNRDDRRNFSRAIPRRIPAEVVYDAMKQATAATDQQQAVRTNLRRRASGHLSMRMAGTHAMKVFGKPDRSTNCDCERVNEPTLLQAIFLQNDPLVRMRVVESGWILELEDAEVRGALPDRDELVKAVWLRTVGRPPTSEESQRALRHVQGTATVSESIADLVWAMLNTKEFLLNH